MHDALIDLDHINIKEIAAALRLSHSQAKRKATGGGWAYREKVMPQGGLRRVYHIPSLPEDIRDAVLARQVRIGATLPAPATPAVLPTPAPEPALLADWQRRTRDARAAILQHVSRVAALAGTGRFGAAIDTVVRLAAAGELPPELQSLVPAANARSGGTDGERTLSRETLYRWLRDHAAHGLAGLAPKDGKRPAPVPAWLPPLLKLTQTPSKRSLQACLEDLPAHLPSGVAVPSPSTARRWMDRIAPQVRAKGRMGHRALLALKAFRRRDTSMLEPLDVVVADGHTFRARVAHPFHGQPFQPEVCALMDAATRYVFGWSAGLAESAHTVMDCIRHGVSSLGVFAIMYTDNGSGFCNEVMSDELTGMHARLGSTHERATPGRAQARGLIERPQSSLWRRSAKKLPTYMGRDMDEDARKRLEKLIEKDLKATGTSPRLPSWQQFLDFIQAEVDAYNNRPHRALPKIRDPRTGSPRHMTPAECLRSWRDKGWEPWTLPAAELDDLFRPYERRRTNRAEVRLPWGRYFDRALEPFHGDDVLVGYDIHDGEKVWVRTLEGRLICIAGRDANLQPYMPASQVEHARKKRAEGRVKRKQRHIDDIQAEAAGAGSILDLTAETVLTPDEIAAADTLYAALEPPAASPAPAPPSDERPRFADDQSWARWLVAHPDAATAADRKHLADQLRRNSFRMLMVAEDVDLAALAAAATPTHRTETTDA